MGSTIKTGIGLMIIAVAIIVLIFSFRKFVFPALGEFGKATGDAFSSASKGFQDFFNSFDSSQSGFKKGEADPAFLAEQSNTQVVDQIKALDPKSPTYEQDKLQLARDNGITGADKITVTPNGGLHIVQNDKPQNNNSFFGLPSAFAEPYQAEQTVVQVFPASLDINRQIVNTLNPKAEATLKTPEPKPQGTTPIQGVVINRVGTEQEFQVFSSDSSKPVFGSINTTPIDPKKLQVDSNKVPLETASERANRVFLETGNFVDVSKGATSYNGQFDFGTNDSSALKLPTVNIAGTKGDPIAEKIQQQRIDELKRLEAQKALSVFNSAGIQKF